MSEEKQTITVPVESQTVEILENLESQWYNSSRKKGQVIDRVVQSYADEGGLEAKVDQILSIVSAEDGASGRNTHTLAPSSNSESEHSEELEALVEEVEAGNPVDPDEWSDEVIQAASGRGHSPFNPDNLVACILKHELAGEVEQEDIVEAYQVAGYATRTAKQYARDYTNTHTVIDTDQFYDDFLEVGKEQNMHMAQGYEVHKTATNREEKALSMFKEEYPSVSAYIGSDLQTEGAEFVNEQSARVALQDDLGLLAALEGSTDGFRWALKWYAANAPIEDLIGVEAFIESQKPVMSDEAVEMVEDELDYSGDSDE